MCCLLHGGRSSLQSLLRNAFKVRYAEQYSDTWINQTFLEGECGIAKEEYLEQEVWHDVLRPKCLLWVNFKRIANTVVDE